jgi:type III secretion protein U
VRSKPALAPRRNLPLCSRARLSDKTEEATPGRLRKAIAEGDVPVSATLVSAGAFVATSLVLPSLGGALVERCGALLRRAPELPADTLALGALAALLLGAVPPLAVAAAVAALLGGVQARGALAPGKLSPDLSRLAGGLGSLVSGQRAASTLRGLVTALIVAQMLRGRLTELLPALAATVGRPAQAAELAARESARLARDVGFVLLASAVVDLALTIRSWRNRLKMSPDEVKREARESEGDPQLKAARERAHHELLTQAAVHAVKDASVVIVNPTHLATALRYQDEDDAPTVVSQGEGAIARQILEAARAYNIPIVRDVPLARALHELEVGDQIPEALYEAVAEILRSLWDAPPEE